MNDIIVEGDAKLCIDAFNDFFLVTPWKIQTLIANARALIVEFSSVSVCWVNGDANMVAHSLAKFAYSFPISLLCNSLNLLLSVHEAWLRNLSYLVS